MELFKTIFSGRLDFGNDRSYDKVFKLFEHRVENYYRNSIILKSEDIFDESTYSIDIPRLIVQSSSKNWKNTINLLNYVVQYAIAGDLRAWRTKDGILLDEIHIEPEGEKIATRSYIKGRTLISSEGKIEDAKSAFDKAILKFERHAMAYERRGKINLMLKNYKDAAYDFNKSISVNPNMPKPYIGLAKVHYLNGEIKEACDFLDMATKKCIPHQPIYWKAKRMKGECHMLLKEYDKAIFDFKMFVKRRFNEGNPNIPWLSNVYMNYGKALLASGASEEAIEAFDAAIDKSNESSIHFNKMEAFLYRGMARQKAGIKGFTTDWKEAANMGSKKAEELLEVHA